MPTQNWNDLRHKISPQERDQIKREAVAELEGMGFAALRKARQQTQIEMAEKLGINQASVSEIESRSDLLLSTLAKYIRALGGDIEIHAVFPDASFNLEPLIPGVVQVRHAPTPITRHKAAPVRRTRTAVRASAPQVTTSRSRRARTVQIGGGKGKRPHAPNTAVVANSPEKR